MEELEETFCEFQSSLRETDLFPSPLNKLS